jgi:RNA polymerase sigma-70 factor, ECF subfamily
MEHPGICRIVIRGRLSERLGSAFPELSIERRPGRTVIHGALDRARLDDVLDRLLDLGLEPVRVDTGADAAPAADAALLAALRDGDEAAFVTLVRQHHAVLLHVAMTYVSTRAVAEEVVQETWLAVLTGVERFEGRSSLRTWIVRIAANIARTRAAREWRSRPFSSLPSREAGAREPAVEPERFLPPDHSAWPGQWARGPVAWQTPEERLLAGETQDVIRAAIAALAPAQRLVVTLRDVEGWSAGEVCDALELTAANQRVLLHRARAKVRAALERHLAAAETAA